MCSLLKVIAVAISLLITHSSCAPAPLPVIDVEDQSLETIRSPDANITDLIDFEDDGADTLDDEDDFAYLDEWQSPNPRNAMAAPDAYLDCRGIEELCDANCYAILCLNRPSILSTKGSQDNAKSNRRKAGVSYQPFKGTTARLRARGLRRPDGAHVSAEEYPFASTMQGGSGADLFPATVADQRTQRDAIRSMYYDYGINTEDNFNLQFLNANTPYCNALARGDYSVCDKNEKDKGPWGFDFGRFAFTRDSLKNQRLHFSFVGK